MNDNLTMRRVESAELAAIEGGIAPIVVAALIYAGAVLGGMLFKKFFS